MKLIFSTAAIALLIVQTLLAKPEKDTARRVRFLAVGEMPPFRQEIRGDVRHELEPPAGSIPPREIIVNTADDKVAAARLRLGTMSEPFKVPNGAAPLLLKRKEAAADAEPWLRIACPEKGDFLVMLWRDAAHGTWEKARSFILPDDLASAPAGSVRIVNVSQTPVRFVIGDEKLILEAGKFLQRMVSTDVEQAFQVLLPDATGNLRNLHSGVITQNPGERSLVTIFRADSETPRRPLKVSVQREPIPRSPEK